MKIRTKIYQSAIRDFYGKSKFRELKKNKPQITDEERDAIWYIKTNLADIVYRRSLIRTLSD